MFPIHKNILENFSIIDSLLSQFDHNSIFYHALFSIRTRYCVYIEFLRHKHQLSWIYLCKKILKIGINILSFLFTRITIINPSKIMILEGFYRFDIIISKELNIDIIDFKKRFTLKIFGKRVKLLVFYLKFISHQLIPNLKFSNLIYCIPYMFDFIQYYHNISTAGIGLIITENDLDPIQYAILLKSKENNVIRVKIEYVQIDSITHNNVFADYYFYPSSYHLNIRKNCAYNVHLKYLKGGYLTKVDPNPVQQLKDNGKLTVTYFSGHSNLFEHSDIFYIKEILSFMPENSTLNIKIHPFDQKEKYAVLKNDRRVSLIMYGDIDNLLLIQKSNICLSIFSVMSLTAKEICNHSYFINYDIENSSYRNDYIYLGDFFDIINSPLMLENVINGKSIPKSFDVFRENVNMTYPDTFHVFQDFIHSLSI